MAMTRRKVVIGLLLLGGLCCCLVFGNPLGEPIDEASYGLIADGMTRRQVDHILGGPPFTEHLAYVRAGGGGAIYEATWSGNVHLIQVLFDDHGIVVGKRLN
jgi:hypothetical protein